MKKHKALVVEDDPLVIDTLDAILFSIGHKYDWVTNQQDAQEKLKGNYSYVLLDLQIPAKPNRGGADKEFGIHLLEHMQKVKGSRGLPVIMMTANHAACLDLASALTAKGVWDFVAKPFENKGRTLAQVIREVLAKKEKAVKETAPQAAQEKCFAGGELTLQVDRAELCGVKIITATKTGQTMLVLRQLSGKDAAGRYLRLSAEDLAKAIKARGGPATVNSCIYTLRRNIQKRLHKQARITCQLEDVIGHDEQGYFLQDWIVVRAL